MEQRLAAHKSEDSDGGDGGQLGETQARTATRERHRGAEHTSSTIRFSKAKGYIPRTFSFEMRKLYTHVKEGRKKTRQSRRRKLGGGLSGNLRNANISPYPRSPIVAAGSGTSPVLSARVLGSAGLGVGGAQCPARRRPVPGPYCITEEDTCPRTASPTTGGRRSVSAPPHAPHG